ncbi:hypothetical protein [Chryseobacterium sp. KMC2]|uniref:hypothetical protein n=1 Tax=Chryseobacterium sp. KMC2 TaxID=2800705 RepID=UPI001924BDE5|nr:hypothetical protein [Chryseobacterium sp. KMC2]MBL3545950.1 hypothetical protein [Chryseobacterium sp. KMC2]
MYKFIIIVLLFLSQIVKGQDSLLLKFIPLPNKTYESIVSQNIHTTMDYKGSSFIITLLKSQGITFPYTTESVNKLHSMIKTSTKKNGRMPIDQKYLSFESVQKPLRSNTEIKVPVDAAEVFGYYDNQNIYHFDSISGPKFNTVELEKIRTKLEEPGKAQNDILISTGKSFEKESAVSFFFIGAGMVAFDVKTEYKLQKITNGIGYLDTTMQFKLKSKNNKVKVLPSSTGSGKIEYDIENQCIKNENSIYKIFSDVIVDKSVISITLIVNNSENKTLVDSIQSP